jgi:uncharacterized protein (AIM24 family)
VGQKTKRCHSLRHVHQFFPFFTVFFGQVAPPKESFFLQTLRCRGGLGEVLVAPQELGDIATVTLGQALQGIMVTEGGMFCWSRNG